MDTSHNHFSEELTYVCSPLSAPTRSEMLTNTARASTYMVWAEKEFGGRAVAPHAVLPYLLDDRNPQERALALEFGQKLMMLCSRLVVYGPRISEGMKNEIKHAESLGIPVIYRNSSFEESVAASTWGGAAKC